MENPHSRFSFRGKGGGYCSPSKSATDFESAINFGKSHPRQTHDIISTPEMTFFQHRYQYRLD